MRDIKKNPQEEKEGYWSACDGESRDSSKSKEWLRGYDQAVIDFDIKEAALKG